MSRKRISKYEEKTLREKQIDFKRHLRAYLVVSLFLAALNAGTGGIVWAIWPILGWGCAVAIQGMGIYGPLKTHEDEDIEFSGPLPNIPDEPRKVPLREQENLRFDENDLV